MTSAYYTVWSGTHAGYIVFVTADGYVRMIDGASQLIWKSPTAIAGASFPLLVPDQNVLYVGSTDGELHQLSLVDGRQTATKQVGDSTATVGSPVYDGLAQVLYVGSSDGTLYRYAVPF